MNQPISFTWNQQSAEAALKAGSSAGISETGAYEGVITSAVYEFGKDGSQSQALVLSLDADGQKANFLRINFLGRDGTQTFGMGLIAAIMWAAQVKDAQAQQRQGKAVLNGVCQHWKVNVSACSCKKSSPPRQMVVTATNSKSDTFSSREAV